MFFEDFFHFEAFAHCPIIVVFVELSSGSFTATPARYGVIMKRKTLHTVSYTIHQYISPVIVVIAGSAGNLEEMVAVVVAAIGGVTTVQVCIVFGTHTAATSPTFISYTQIFNLPCFVAPVFAAKVRHRRVTVRCHIFYPFGEFLYRTAAYISTDVWFATQHFTQV